MKNSNESSITQVVFIEINFILRPFLYIFIAYKTFHSNIIIGWVTAANAYYRERWVNPCRKAFHPPNTITQHSIVAHSSSSAKDIQKLKVYWKTLLKSIYILLQSLQFNDLSFIYHFYSEATGYPHLESTQHLEMNKCLTRWTNPAAISSVCLSFCTQIWQFYGEIGPHDYIVGFYI